MKSLLALILTIALVGCSSGRNGQDGKNGASGTPSTKDNGGMTGGGGEVFAQEIAVYSTAIVVYLQKHPLPQVPTDSLKKTVEQTKISIKDSLTLRGDPVSAINHPERAPMEIEFSRASLAKIENEKDQIVRLVFHEFLGILKIDDTDPNDLNKYKVSILINAPEIVHEVLVAEGKFVPTRLVTIDFAKIDESQLECRYYWDTAYGSAKHVNIFTCSLAVQTEKLIAHQLLKENCRFGDFVSDKNVVEEAATEDGLRVFVSGVQGMDAVGNIISKTPGFHSKSDVLGYVKSCKFQVLIYPDPDVE